MSLQFHDLAELDAPISGQGGGTPMLLPLDSIDEDPEQPRREFDAETLQELADTIRERGVRQPVSVRPHPAQPGRWMLNFGARRLRASQVAGLTEIPAFVDASADSYDQVIENEQREGLSPLELALFVQKRLAQGETQADIARKMGRSRAYVTYATALIDAPDWLVLLYREGRCRVLHLLHELRRLHQEHPKYIEAWAADRPVITRHDVDALRAELARDAAESVRLAPSALTEMMDEQGAQNPTSSEPTQGPAFPVVAASAALNHPAKPGDRFLVVEKDGEKYELLFIAVPADEDKVYVRPLQGGSRQEVRADTLTLRGIRCR